MHYQNLKAYSMKKQIIVVFRFDDYSAKSSTDIELKIIDLFRKNKFSVTFGVIPFITAGDEKIPSKQDVIPLPRSKGNILQGGLNEGVLDIALHGYSHQTIGIGKTTEFLGLDYDDQLERLAKGKKFLEEMIENNISTFIPPWNQYDLNTLQALEKLNFSTLSAGIDGHATKGSKINFLPASSDLSRLRNSVELARTYSEAQSVIVTLLHEYDFKEISEKRGITTCQELSDLLSWLKSQEDLHILSISQATKLIDDLSVNRFLLNQQNSWLTSNFLHSFLQKKVPGSVYRQQSYVLLQTLLKIASFYLLVIVFGVLISLIMWVIVFPNSSLITSNTALAITVMSGVILVYTFCNWQVKNIIISAGAIGASVGSWLSFLYSSRY
jgi:peptidoglycan/xylan/chitin deacetylase (PgdA/CDA1 family)